MTAPEPQPTRQGASERLAAALGWSRLPVMTEDERAAFDADEQRAEAEAVDFYRRPAA